MREKVCRRCGHVKSEIYDGSGPKPRVVCQNCQRQEPTKQPRQPRPFSHMPRQPKN